MKKRLPSLLLPLVILSALTAQALAAESGEWRKRELEFEKEYVAQQIKARPEEYAAFDADERYYQEYPMAKEAYMADEGIDQEQFRREMWAIELGPETRRAYKEYITAAYEAAFPGELEAVGIPWALMVLGGDTVEEKAAEEYYQGDVRAAWLDLAEYYIGSWQMVAENHDTTLEYRAQYPGSYEEYDPYAQYTPGWEHMIQNTMDRYGLQSDEEFKEYWYVRYMEGYIRERARNAAIQGYLERWPQEYADFDERAWFAGNYKEALAHGGVEGYMEDRGLDAEGFKRAMFAEWAGRETCFFAGYCVTVDGAPIRFWEYQDEEGSFISPRAENSRILVPLRPAAEALGLTVEWKPETNQVVCADETAAVTFTLGSAEYSGGTLDAAPFAENGVTYLPLRALGEALGCGVEWKGDFATAALTTR